MPNVIGGTMNTALISPSFPTVLLYAASSWSCGLLST